jgi:tRNA pseudouridine55 synthase
MNPNFDGLLVLDKPQGITSRDALNQALRWFPRRTKMGHTGTLDPLATGVLVLCLGTATRLVEYVQDMSKTYRSLFRLGATSDSDDADGQLTPTPNAVDPGLANISRELTHFLGAISQVPPAYSAARVAGQRAYDLARKGTQVDLEPRIVRIDRVEILRYDWPELEVEVDCGKGTYIRSLARDLGSALGCGAYVQTLRRTRVGPFHADDAVSLSTPKNEAITRVQGIDRALAELPRVELGERRLQRLRQGQKLDIPENLANVTGAVGVFDEQGRAVAVAEVEGGLLRPAKVFG